MFVESYGGEFSQRVFAVIEKEIAAGTCTSVSSFARMVGEPSTVFYRLMRGETETLSMQVLAKIRQQTGADLNELIVGK